MQDKPTTFRAVVDRIEGDTVVLELTDAEGKQHFVAMPEARDGDVFLVELRHEFGSAENRGRLIPSDHD